MKHLILIATFLVRCIAHANTTNNYESTLDSNFYYLERNDSLIIDSTKNNTFSPITSQQTLQRTDQEFILQYGSLNYGKMGFWGDIGKAFQDAYDFVTFKNNFGYFEVGEQTSRLLFNYLLFTFNL